VNVQILPREAGRADAVSAYLIGNGWNPIAISWDGFFPAC
jgi:hypothetical protein